MICQICNKRPASVHVTRVINGVKSELYLCAQCAKEKEGLGIDSNMADFAAPFSFPNILGSLIDFAGMGAVPYEAPEQLKCPECGTDYEEFKKTGLFGCSQCYYAFGDRLEPLIKRIHGNIQHTGKVPKRTGGVIRLKRDIESLKYQLKKAIENEEYEKAASLRDRIKKLENKE